jgi:hypothetical protein
MSMVVEVGEVESTDCLGEPRPRGKGLPIYTGLWTSKERV